MPAIDQSIPQDRREAVRAALHAAFPHQTVAAIEPLSGGASGAGIYRFAVRERDYVLRVDGAPFGLRDPARQYACHGIAAKAGVAPQLVFADAGTRVCISAFAQSAPYGGPRGPRLAAAARALAALHAAPLFPPLMPYFDAMRLLLGNLTEREVLPAEMMADILALFGRAADVYPASDADIVSSHNDLNPGNILFDGTRALIVDWESAFAADRYIDLAALTNFLSVEAADEALILETYFGRPATAGERDRLLVMRQVNRLFYGAALLIVAALRDPAWRPIPADLDTPRFADARGDLASMATPKGATRFAFIFLNEARREMRSPAFEAALARL